MKPCKLGNSGLQITPMGLGLAALGRPGYINLGHGNDLEEGRDIDAMKARAHEVLDAAWRAGIRYFDAARSYGRAEEFLGAWLETREPEGAVVGSKWGYTYTANWRIDAEHHEVKEHSLPVLQRQILESREQLGGALNLYQIHSATLESGVLENEPVLDRLATLKEEGVRIGLSVSGPRQADVVRKAIGIRIDERQLFDCVQATWNLLEQSAGEALKEAHQAGLGVIIKEGLANGRLTARNGAPNFAAKLRQLETAAETVGATIDQLALAAILNQPWVGTVLSGAATVEHLIANTGAPDVDWSDELWNRVKDLKEDPEEYWSTRSGLKWN